MILIHSSRSFSKCIASSFAGQDTMIADISQNAVLFGYDFGSKIFMIIDEQVGNRRLLQTSQNTSIDIVGIKRELWIRMSINSV